LCNSLETFDFSSKAFVTNWHKSFTRVVAWRVLSCRY